MDVDGFLEVLAGPARRHDRARRGRHRRALRLRARDPELAALHVPRRRAARGAADAGRLLPPRSRGAGPRRARLARSRTPSRASARRRGRSPANAEEMHEALLWMGYVTDEEAAAETGASIWTRSQADRRVVHEDGRWFAAEASRDPKAILRGRLEALGPIESATMTRCCSSSRPRASCLRTRIAGRPAWCDRRLLARIHRYTLDRLRREIEPVTAAQFVRFLARWQHAAEEHRLDGPSRRRRGRRPARRLRDARLGLGGDASFPRAFGATSASGSTSSRSPASSSGAASGARATGPIRRAPISLVPARGARGLAKRRRGDRPARAGGNGRARPRRALGRRRHVLSRAPARRPVSRPPELQADLEELIALGLGDVRRLLGPAGAPRSALEAPPAQPRGGTLEPARAGYLPRADSAEFVARKLLRRTGVVFRKTLEREKQPLPWREIARALRHARGTRRGPGRPFRRGLRRRAVRAAGGDPDPARGAAPRRGETVAVSRVRRRPAQLPRDPHARRARRADDAPSGARGLSASGRTARARAGHQRQAPGSRQRRASGWPKASLARR